MSDAAIQNRRNRRAGQRWQADLRDGLRSCGLDVERLALAGAQDEGDHVIRLRPQDSLLRRRFVIAEAKAGVLHPAAFVHQAHLEAANYARHRGLPSQDVTGIAVAKRRGTNWRHAYVLTTVADYFGLDAQ